MGLLTQTVRIKWNSRNKKYYINKGYIFTKMGDEFEVKCEDLSDGNEIYVKVQCDCGTCKNAIKKTIWTNYKRTISKYNNKYYCQKCINKLFGVKKRINKQLKKSESFYSWCYKNLTKKQADEIIEKWDMKLNKCSPKDVCYSSIGFNKKGYWFKCLKHSEHCSELKNINSLTSKMTKKLKCNQCGSFAQWGIDNLGEDFLEKYWDYDKNNKLSLDPWKMPKGRNKKVWIICQEKSYHGSYLVQCNSFINGSRCPYCHNKKIHRFDSLGWLYPQVFDIWSNKNKKSPYEYSPFSDKEIWWTCLDKKHKDYKRKILNSQTCKFRCPECTRERTESMIQEKTRLYLEKLGYIVLHENNCTLVPINPKKTGKNNKLPFDNEIKLINGKHLICEVNGIQHYEELHKDCKWLRNRTSKECLYYRKLKDRYKRFISYVNGYEYLELPYWAFDDKDTYKNLIKNKINQILNKKEGI